MALAVKIFISYITELVALATDKNTSGHYLKDFGSALEPTVKLAAIASPFVLIINTLMTEFSVWVFDSRIYISIVLFAILVDWFFGSWKHLKRRTFSLKNNAIGLLTKISLTVGGGFLFEGVNFLTKDTAVVSSLLEVITRLVVFFYPTLSALQSIYIVSEETFPPKILIERIQRFNSSLKPEDLKGGDEDSSDKEYYD